jgi:hypothetical protein
MKIDFENNALLEIFLKDEAADKQVCNLSDKP